MPKATKHRNRQPRRWPTEMPVEPTKRPPRPPSRTGEDLPTDALAGENAQIVADCARLEFLEHEVGRYIEANDEGPEFQAIDAEHGELFERLIVSTATTPKARLAKARIAMVLAQRDREGNLLTNGASDDVAYSALADIIGVDWDVYPVPPNTVEA